MKLIDADRKQIEALIEAPDMARDAAPLVRALARIDELEAQIEECAHHTEPFGLIRDDVAKLIVDGNALRKDVADLRGALEAVALRTNADDSPCFCAIRIPTGTAHHLSCQRAAGVLARTAPK